MLVRFWGTRGSIPRSMTALEVKSKIREALAEAVARDVHTPIEIDKFIEEELDFSIAGSYGGNTSCVEIETGGEEFVICDLGSGARAFSERVLSQSDHATIHIFMSHLHWDHIMGFPFFVPAYRKGYKIFIYGGHTELEAAFRRQHSSPHFPVEFSALSADIEFITLSTDKTHHIAGLEVRMIEQFHEGKSFGYRFEKDGKILVYSTDCEHNAVDIDEHYPFVKFFRQADLLIFDAMYSLAESVSVKEDWGHSNNLMAVELAQAAAVRHLCLFHHEPVNNDNALSQILSDTRRYHELSGQGGDLVISSAFDGLEIEL